MTRVSFAAVAALSALLATPSSAQVGMRASTATDQVAGDNAEIVVQGQRKSIMRQLRALIARSAGDQLARFEDKLCPMVIGMPRDWTATMTRMIRSNIEAVGAKLEPLGCRPNGLVIFIDQPAELVEAFRKEEPWLLNMPPHTAKNFVASVGSITSWHVTDTRGAKGEMLGTMEGSDAKVTRGTTSSRLYTPARQEMTLGMVVVEKGKTVGLTLRQLADLATMHLLLEVRSSAGAKDPSSILSVFEPRPANYVVPQRMSRIDRGAMAGFYAQRENNLTAAQQRSNIANAIERGVGEPEQ